MSLNDMNYDKDAIPDIQGHMMGFMDSAAHCQQVVNELSGWGIDESRIRTLSGPAGLETFRAMLNGYSWGEESDQMVRVGEIEFGNNHVVLCVEADRDEGLQIAHFAQSLGGHGFRHFGILTDERLTA